MTSYAIVKLTAEEKVWLGADVEFHVDTPVGKSATGQVVALAPKPGCVWICDGQHFHQIPIADIQGAWTEETLL